MNKTKNNWQHSLWHSNFFTIFLLVLLVLSFIKVAREALLRYEIKKEINSLQGQLDGLQNRSAKTNNLISYLQTDEYIEKEAREKLNLAQPGEKQINLITNKTSLLVETDSSAIKANPSKWFDYFFN